MPRFLTPTLSGLILVIACSPGRADIIVAEGEKFTPQDKAGWRLTHQNDSYASHTYGGMWVTHGGGLGAPAESVGSVAVQAITVPSPGKYRVWSKYQAPAYFNHLHQIDIIQNNKTVFTHVYGKKGTDRLWSFSGQSNELWWPWGIDHDAAEAPAAPAELASGPAVIRLVTVANAKPAGDRFIDFVLLTTNQANDYEGFNPYKVGSPFANEALAATQLYLRFQNTTDKPAVLQAARRGHFQPNYGGATAKFPAAAVAPGQWSAWFNLGPFCRLVHDEGLVLTLPGAKEFGVQLARDPAGKDLVGDLRLASGDEIVIPLEITWKQDARVKTSRQLAAEVIALTKTWRKANSGKKPREILFYGAFSGQEDWVHALKDALGYNTLLPEKYEHARRDGLHAHVFGVPQIQKYAATLKDKDRLRVLSFGDEIHLGEINYKDPKNQERFRAWLKAKGVTQAELGVEPDAAPLAKTGDTRLAWYANLFNEEERFAVYRENTQAARVAIGPNVLTGANYSPHTLALFYGPVYQWVDIFKHQGMSLMWAEDYVFSVPEVPQIISWQFAQMRCGVKYHNQPIHFYVMPHAPGQLPGYLRRNLLLSVGFGARHIDNFWIAPAERFTENYVSWSYPDTFRVLHESIYDTAEAERLQVGGKVRPARVAVVTGKATDFNESRLMLPKEQDPFAKDCKNAPAQLNQILCRKDQQMLYLALRQAQHAVDVITEDDIVEGQLKQYDVVYFAGEWIDRRAVAKLDAWVESGGVLYACAGCGHLNQFNAPEPAMTKLLGLKGSTIEKDAVILRTLLELPLLPPIDTITLNGQKVPAVGMRQRLAPASAKVLGTWSDGSAAVTVHEYGKGKAFAVGTLAGNSWMKTALKPIPWARGGRKTVYNPTEFDPAATHLVRLGAEARKVEQPVTCSVAGVEGIVIDHPQGTLLTLVNWTNAPIQGLKVAVRLPATPKSVRSVTGQKPVPVSYASGVASLTLDLAEGDFLLLSQ